MDTITINKPGFKIFVGDKPNMKVINITEESLHSLLKEGHVFIKDGTKPKVDGFLNPLPVTGPRGPYKKHKRGLGYRSGRRVLNGQLKLSRDAVEDIIYGNKSITELRRKHKLSASAISRFRSRIVGTKAEKDMLIRKCTRA